MTFEIIDWTTATLKSITPRQEHRGDQTVVALSMRLEIASANTLLDLLSPKLRPALYTAADGQEQLPGVEPTTPLLRFDAFEHHAIKACFEGWTLRVEHGLDETITLGGCKVDALRLEAMQGGTVLLAFRVGTNDVSSEDIGLLCGKLGSEISITLAAPEKAAEPIDGSPEAFKRDHPEAGGGASVTDLFARGSGGPGDTGESDSEGGDLDAGDGQRVFKPPAQPGTRTARGRAKTAKALADGEAS